MTPETTRMLEQFFFFNLSENDNTDDRWHLFCPGINWMSVILWVLALCLLAKLFQLYVLLLFTLAQFCNFSMSSLFFFLCSVWRIPSFPVKSTVCIVTPLRLHPYVCSCLYALSLSFFQPTPTRPPPEGTHSNRQTNFLLIGPQEIAPRFNLLSDSHEDMWSSSFCLAGGRMRDPHFSSTSLHFR